VTFKRLSSVRIASLTHSASLVAEINVNNPSSPSATTGLSSPSRYCAVPLRETTYSLSSVPAPMLTTFWLA
jgi:hypothetical protein